VATAHSTMLRGPFSHKSNHIYAVLIPDPCLQLQAAMCLALGELQGAWGCGASLWWRLCRGLVTHAGTYVLQRPSI